ncbi:adenylate cyclase [Beijerinckiaceae bacterium]|nr:adenylate cyclase [Beijerinckiaceae bacterium]
MSEGTDNDPFYENIPVFEGFGRLMEPALYQALPDGWAIGIADIVQSTKAIRENHYKAVNMAGAAVIAALKNALDGREFPYVFAGDGATFAVPPHDIAKARDALAATAAWVKSDLSLVMRVALVPLAIVRAQGLDVRVARFAPSPNISYAMFSGGGLEWAEAAMRRGEFAVVPASPTIRPDLTGLSCRFEEMPAARGLVLSLLIVPGADAETAAFRAVIEDVVAVIAKSPDMSKPVPPAGPRLRWPSAGVELEARTLRRVRTPLFFRRGLVLARTFLYYLILNLKIRVGSFVPAVYLQQVVENSDFRKFADGLRMILDCTPELADAIEKRLEAAAAAGTVRYGLHRQDAAVMTCFTPSPTNSNHVHFIDGARGGYAAAAMALKAKAA